MQDTSTFFNATKTCLQKKLFLKKALSVASKIENKIKAQSEFWNYFICFIWEELTGNCTLSGLLFTSFMLIGVTYIISFKYLRRFTDATFDKISLCIISLCIILIHLHTWNKKERKALAFSALYFWEQAVLTKPAPRVRNILIKCSISFHKAAINTIVLGTSSI